MSGSRHRAPNPEVPASHAHEDTLTSKLRGFWDGCGVTPTEFLVNELDRAYHAHLTISITWLNHHSAHRALGEPSISTFDFVGIDGKLLQFIVGGRYRTSADLVLPSLLPRLQDARVALVGGRADTLNRRSMAVGELLSRGSTVVLALDGYAGLPGQTEFASHLRRCNANVVVVALGGGLQEAYAACAKQTLDGGGIVATCGGLLDQLLLRSYYPRWAYPLRLNWLVRLAREPARMWRRYTVEALAALSQADELRRRTLELPGLWV